MSIRVAILGASGIGKYHAREFHNADCEVVAILGSTEESAIKTAEMLNREFSITATPYSDLDKLLSKEKIDAVSICTPPETHEEFVVRCLNKNLDVLCEKPLIGGTEELVAHTNALIALAKKKGRTLAVNTQMSALIPESLPVIINNFSVYTEPGTKGEEMILDHGPHLNSMLIKLVPEGKASDVRIEKQTEEEFIVKFNYESKKQRCSVEYHLKHKSDRPRAIKFQINDMEYSREIGERYEQFLVSEGKRTEIEDPLKTSISRFVKAIEGNSAPLISTKEILENAQLQAALISKLVKD